MNNPASCQVALHVEFVEEAVLGQQHLHADRWHDIHIHTRLRQQQLSCLPYAYPLEAEKRVQQSSPSAPHAERRQSPTTR